MGRLCSRFLPQKAGWRAFCRPGTKFCEHYVCRGSSLIGAENLSSVTKLVAGTGAVSRYNLSRSQKFVKVQDLNCVQMRALPTDFVGRSRLCRSKAEAKRRWVSGCKNHYKFGGGHWRSVAIQFVSEPEICQGAGFELCADARFAHRLRRP